MAQKGIAHIFIIFLLLAGIIAGVYLAQKTQIFKPKAYYVSSAVFTDATGIKLPERISDPNVYLLINPPEGWIIPSQSPLNFLPFIKNAYAKEDCTENEDGSLKTCRGLSYNAQNLPSVNMELKSFCSYPHGVNNDEHLDFTIKLNIEGNVPKNKYVLLSITDEKTKETGYINMGVKSSTFEFHNFFDYGNQQFKLEPDGRDYAVNAYLASSQDLELSSDDPLLAKASFSHSCKFITPPPKTTHIIKEIIIENADSDQSSGGSDPLHITSNFSNFLNKPIEWRINSLKLDQKDLPRVERNVRVTFIDENLNAEGFYPYIYLKYQTLSAGDQIPVDVVIDRDYEDIKEVEDWVKDALNIYVNEKLRSAGIKRAVKFNSSFVNQVGSCDGSWSPQLQPATEEKIVLYISKKPSNKSWAFPDSNIICLAGFDKENIISKSILTHELGHIFGLPDYYLEQIFDNQVISSLFLDAYNKDIMYFYNNLFDFNSASSTIVNQLSNPLPGNFGYWIYYSPKQVFLQIMGESGLPLPGAEVDIFPAIYDWREGSEYVHRFVPNNPSLTLVTDSTGRIFLGDQAAIFNHKKYPYSGTTGAALVRVKNKKEVRYGALSMSYLNSLYFAQNPNGVAMVSFPFSQMADVSDLSQFKTIRPFSEVTILEQKTAVDLDSEEEKHLYSELKATGKLQKHKIRD